MKRLLLHPMSDGPKRANRQHPRKPDHVKKHATPRSRALSAWQLGKARRELKHPGRSSLVVPLLPEVDREALRPKTEKKAKLSPGRALKALRLYQRELRALAAQLITVQEQERQRLARDIHDDPVQRMAALAIEVEGLAQNPPPTRGKQQEAFRRVYATVTSIAEELRRLSHNLHPAILQTLGLVGALRSVIHEWSQRDHVHVMFNQRGVLPPIPKDVALCLYRITQECLQNIAKHAEASEVVITLAKLKGSLRLSIRDCGKGFSPRQLTRWRHGLGFVSMRERMRLVKGRLHIKSQPGVGTTVLATVPLRTDAIQTESS